MKTKYSSLFSLPYLIWSLIFIIVPMGLVVVFAFTTESGQFTLDYVSQVGEYTSVLVRSVWLAAIATVICLLIGYPLAFIPAADHADADYAAHVDEFSAAYICLDDHSGKKWVA